MAAERYIQITRSIVLDTAELQETFVRASGPGGQNVNKVSTAVDLRFDAANSPSLSDYMRERIISFAGSRVTQDGVIFIRADRHRTQERNRADALERLIDLIRQAAAPPPPPRRATKPTKSSVKKRLEGKTKRGAVKAGRSGRKIEVD